MLRNLNHSNPNLTSLLSFLQKKRVSARLGGLRCDVHSHLIPGIDDGSPDLETSVQLIRGLIDLGYQKIITTPHINVEGFPNTPDIIRSGQEVVTAELRRLDIGIPFHAAAEYLLDYGFSLRLAAGEPLLTLKDNLILVELSFVVPIINLREILFEMQVKGYQPVLAHPERYLYFWANKGWYDKLRDAGCLFQLNLLSFAGYYGSKPRDIANYLVKKGYVDYLGTDLHHPKHLEELRTSAVITRTVERLIDGGLIRNMEL